jgi:hypothetical protein
MELSLRRRCTNIINGEYSISHPKGAESHTHTERERDGWETIQFPLAPTHSTVYLNLFHNIIREDVVRRKKQ